MLECKVKWALGSMTMNKASGGDGIPVELLQILKDDAVKVLHSICQRIWKTQQWPQDWKRSDFIPIPKKGNAKECSNYRAISLISHASKVMLRILQNSFISMWTENFQMFKLDLEKAGGPEIKLPTSIGSSKKQGSSRKTSTSALLATLKPLTLWITTNCRKFLEMGIPDYLIWLLWNLYAGQQATVRTGHGTTEWFWIRKGVYQGYIFSPCLFKLYAEYIMQKTTLDEAQAGIQIAGRDINNLSYTDDPPLWQKAKKS